MRADLGWSYFTAGAMNTVNAAGYLVGALLMPRALARFDARDVLLTGSAGSGVLLGAHGLVASDAALFVLRLLTGAASAAAFVAGGLLAARLAATAEAPSPRTDGRIGPHRRRAGARHLLRRHRRRHHRVGAAGAADGGARHRRTRGRAPGSPSAWRRWRRPR